jgi:hypothetical protein
MECIEIVVVSENKRHEPLHDDKEAKTHRRSSCCDACIRAVNQLIDR